MWSRTTFNHYGWFLQSIEMEPFPPYLRSVKHWPKGYSPKDSKSQHYGKNHSPKLPVDHVFKHPSSLFALSFLSCDLNLFSIISVQNLLSPLFECPSPSQCSIFSLSFLKFPLIQLCSGHSEPLCQSPSHKSALIALHPLGYSPSPNMAQPSLFKMLSSPNLSFCLLLILWESPLTYQCLVFSHSLFWVS